MFTTLRVHQESWNTKLHAYITSLNLFLDAVSVGNLVSTNVVFISADFA